MDQDQEQKQNQTTYQEEPTQYTSSSSQNHCDHEIESTEGQGYGIASLCLGIVGLLLSCCLPVIGFILPILAIIFGVIGMKYPSGKGMAIAGLVLGCIGTVPALLMLFVLIV